MFRRLTLFFLLMVSLVSLASAEAAQPADISDLSIISQWDDRFDNHPCRYRGVAFRNNGCGPASFANAFIAATSVTDPVLAGDVTQDMLYLLCSPKEPKHAKANPSPAQLDYLSGDASIRSTQNSSYPYIDQALKNYGGHISYSNEFITAESLALNISSPIAQPRIIIGRFTSDYRMETLAEIAHLLYQAGYHDATITLAYLGAGTKSTSGPLRSGNAGHHLCLHLRVGEFYETGALYVLDSLPRALEGETYSYNHVYHGPYDFVKGQPNRSVLKPFINTYEPQRVKTTIVRLVPYGDAQQAFEAALASADPADSASMQNLLNTRISQMKAIVSYGISYAFVSLYPPQN